jgi:pimeloyl-[acyl-carrier protein] methyl ester esterase
MPILETSEGVSIHYDDKGTGMPLVFLHGWAMSGDVWRFQQVFAEQYRCIVPDLRGHGRSSAPVSGYSFDCFARDLAELFSSLDLERAIVIAWSMGVHVTLQAFPLIRERLSALVFVSGTARFTAAADYPFGLPPSEARGLGIRLKSDPSRAVLDFAAGMFTVEERNLGCCEMMSGMSDSSLLPDTQAARESLASLASADFRTVLADIDLPVLLIHGSSDTICPAAASHLMAEMLPDARLAVMAGAGHAPFLSRPDEFMYILRKFVDGFHAEN